GGVDVECVVGTALHAGLAADAAVAVEVHDPVRTPVEGDGRADGHAGRVVAVVTAEDREVPARVGIVAALDVLHPRAEGAERHPVLFLARHRARVAADALSLIDHEPVAQRSRSPSLSPRRSATTRFYSTRRRPVRLRERAAF